MYVIAQLSLQCLILKVYSHEIAIFHNPESDVIVSQISMLFDCATSAKSYIEEILLVPVDDMESWSLLEWMQLNHIVLLVSKLVQILDTSGWEDIANRLMTLDSYLECLCDRVRRMCLSISVDSPESEAKLGFQQLLQLWEATRNKNRVYLASIISRNPVHQDMSSTTNILPPAPTNSLQTDYTELMSFGSFDQNNNAFWIPSGFAN